MKRFSNQQGQDYLKLMRQHMTAYSVRLGQSILNDQPDLCPCSDVYYCEDEQRVLDWFYANLVGEGDVLLPTDTSMVINEALRSERRASKVSLVGTAMANRFGAIK